MAPSSRFARLRRGVVACTALAMVNAAWGVAMLLILPGWRTVVSWSAGLAAACAADYGRHVLKDRHVQ